MILIVTKLLKNYSGLTLWPFLLVTNLSNGQDAVFMNHERIHARQQQELLILPFFIWYIVEFAVWRLFMNHNLAYRNIVFEREAYAMETNQEYLKNRKWYSFLRFYAKKHRK